MPNGDVPYEWRENNACVATYKVLEMDMFLDQFEEADIPFKDAALVKMKHLRYFPQTTTNANIIDMLSIGIARNFIKYVKRVFTVKRQNSANSSAEIISAIANVFADKEKTIQDLAELVDSNIKFPDETGN